MDPHNYRSSNATGFYTLLLLVCKFNINVGGVPVAYPSRWYFLPGTPVFLPLKSNNRTIK